MAMQLLNVEQVAEKNGLVRANYISTGTTQNLSTTRKFNVCSRKTKKQKHWAKTEISKWIKSNAKLDVVKLEPKEQAKAEAEDATVLGILTEDVTTIRPPLHKRLIDYIMKWFKR